MDVRLSHRGVTYRTRREDAGRIEVFGEGSDTITVRLESQPGGAYSVTQGDGFQTGHAVRNGDVVWVRWRGRTYCLDVVQGRRSTRSDEGGLTAPMPGQIQRHLVAEGDIVEAGRPLLVMEAMKMQLEIKAPRAGRVKRMLAAEGVQVQGGAILAELEDVT